MVGPPSTDAVRTTAFVVRSDAERRSVREDAITRWVSLGAALILTSLPELARAEPAAHSLEDAVHVKRGVTCLDEDALREQVRSWLDADAVDGGLRVDVVGSDEDERSVSFRMWQKERLIAQRRFDPGPSRCAEMHAVVGLAIALALKVSLRDELLGEVLSPADRAWSLGAAATATWNVIPGVAGGALVWVERALPEHFAAHLGIAGLFGGSTGFERVSGEFMTSSVAVDASLCTLPSLGKRVRGRLCTGLEARTLFASGSGFAVSKAAVLNWFSLENSLGVSVPLAQRWSLVGAVGLVVPLKRVQIVVVDSSGRTVESRDSAAAGAALSVGAAYEF